MVMEAKDSVQMSWSDFQKATLNFLGKAQRSGDFSDVTLACDDGGEMFPAHKIVLSAGSSFFEAAFKRIGKIQSSNPLLYLKGVEKQELELLLTFLYTGEVNVLKEKLEKFLEVAKDLGVKGFHPEKQEQEEKEQSEEIVHREESLDNNMSEETFTNDPEDLEDSKLWTKRPRKIKAATSPVWNFATKMDKMRAQCNLCEKIVPAQEHTWNISRDVDCNIHFRIIGRKRTDFPYKNSTIFSDSNSRIFQLKILSYSKYS